MFRILQISDIHLDDFLSQKYSVDCRKNLIQVLESSSPQRYDHIFITGDLGEANSIQWLRELLDSKRVHYSLCLGNHDNYEAIKLSSLSLSKSESREEYFYSHKSFGTQTVVLDTGKGKISTRQIEWFKNQVEAESGDLLIFCHYPILEFNETMEKYLGHSNRNELRDVLSGSRRNVYIFCGHYHSASTSTLKTIRQFVAPAVIMQIDSAGQGLITKSFDFGAQEIEIDDGKVRVRRILNVSERPVRKGE